MAARRATFAWCARTRPADGPASMRNRPDAPWTLFKRKHTIVILRKPQIRKGDGSALLPFCTFHSFRILEGKTLLELHLTVFFILICFRIRVVPECAKADCKGFLVARALLWCILMADSAALERCLGWSAEVVLLGC